MTQPQIIWSLILNGFVVLFVLLSTVFFFLQGGQGNMREGGKKALVYFTVDSNLLCALACFAVCISDLLALARGGGSLPRWLDLLKFTGSAAVGVTFFTTLCYLLPVSHFDFKLLYAGWNLFLHALCPLAAMISWAFAERGGPMPFPWTLLALIPTALYGAVYLCQVVIRKRWEDFYSFNVGGLWYVSVFVMLLLSFCTGAALRALRLI